MRIHHIRESLLVTLAKHYTTRSNHVDIVLVVSYQQGINDNIKRKCSEEIRTLNSQFTTLSLKPTKLWTQTPENRYLFAYITGPLSNG